MESNPQGNNPVELLNHFRIVNKEKLEALWKKKADRVFVRTCQECGNEDVCQEPKTDKQLYDKKCRKCQGTECFDYGSHRPRYKLTEEEGKLDLEFETLDYDAYAYEQSLKGVEPDV